MTMFKKALTLLIAAELTACIYLLAFCRPSKPVYVKVPPDNDTCADYVARENQAWLENLAKLERMRKQAGVK